MALLIRWVFCLVVVAAHWACGMGQWSWSQGLAAAQPQERPPVQREPIVVMDPQKLSVLPLVRSVVYPIDKQWGVPTNTQTQSGQSQNLPQTQPAAYWVQVPSSYLTVGQPNTHVFGPAVAAPPANLPNYPFLQAPGHSFQSVAMRLLSNPNVFQGTKDVPDTSSQLPATVYLGQPVNPPPKKQVGAGFLYGRPQVPESRDVKGAPPIINQANPVQMSDYPRYVPRKVIPHKTLYKFIPHGPVYVYPVYPRHRPQTPRRTLPPTPTYRLTRLTEPAYSKGPAVLQKQQQPRFELSPEGRLNIVVSNQ